MADIIDNANDIAAEFLEKSLQEHKALVKHKHPYREGEGDYECHECEVIIPPTRRELTGSQYCTDCQEDLDNRSRKF